MQKLKSLGLDNNTIVIFSSDNGGCTSENKYQGVEDELMPMIIPSKREIYEDSPLQYIVTSNSPLRSEKGTLFEGGVREPLIVRWPSKIRSGSVCNAVVSSVDFYPTLIEIAKTEKPEGQIIDGKSMLPAFLGEQIDSNRPVFWHYPVYHHDVPAGSVRKGDWKLIENLVTNNVVLYNLSIDISESTDLSKVFPEKTKELYSLLKEWQREVKAEFPKPNPEFNKERRYEWGMHP
jgi:uncharacterized sulfatase